jgi:hypothetical protein
LAGKLEVGVIVVTAVVVMVDLDLVEPGVEVQLVGVEVDVARTQDTPEQVYPTPYWEVQNALGY